MEPVVDKNLLHRVSGNGKAKQTYRWAIWYEPVLYDTIQNATRLRTFWQCILSAGLRPVSSRAHIESGATR